MLDTVGRVGILLHGEDGPAREVDDAHSVVTERLATEGEAGRAEQPSVMMGRSKRL